MSKNYTKDLIKKEFMKLLDKKTLDNITVTELAQKCQIERKTFYYHYENLEQLIREIFESELDIVIEEFNKNLSLEDSFILAAKFILDNKKAIRHINLISYFYQCALSSSLIQWVATDMKTDPKAIARRIGELMDGNILLSLKRSEKLKEFTQNFDVG